MSALLCTLMLSYVPAPPELADAPRPTVILVVGAAGQPEYGQAFGEWAQRWRAAAKAGGAELFEIGSAAGESSETSAPQPAADGANANANANSNANDRDLLRQAIAAANQDAAQPLWLVFLGHGTFDGRLAKFNLRGRDCSDEELAEWCQPLKRPLALISCASSSAPFLARLSAPNRVVVTATKSGFEQNYSRFGDFFSQAIGDAAADLDKDQQTSLLEAFVFAAKRTAEFYESQGRLATEHPLLEDTGDQRGVSSDWFRGVRPASAAVDQVAVDGSLARRWHLVRSTADQQLTAEQLRQRNGWQEELEQLRGQRERLTEEDYLDRVEAIVVQIARLRRADSSAADQAQAEPR